MLIPERYLCDVCDEELEDVYELWEYELCEKHANTLLERLEKDVRLLRTMMGLEVEG